MNNTYSTVFHHIYQGNNTLSYILKNGEHKTFVFLITPTRTLQADISIELRGKDTKASVFGIVLPQNGASVFLTTRQVHKSAFSTSSFLLRSLLLTDSFVSYTGNIFIGDSANGSDAFQQHDSMLLSSHARVQTKPVLEILQNDVSCKHGATIHPIPEEIMWYAKTRTLNQKHAELLYVNGFLKNLISRIPDPHMQKILEKQCEEKIGSYDKLTQN